MDLKFYPVEIIHSCHLQKERIKKTKASNITNKAKINLLLVNNFFAKEKVTQNNDSKKSQNTTLLLAQE
jgi:hypothetical protein